MLKTQKTILASVGVLAAISLSACSNSNDSTPSDAVNTLADSADTVVTVEEALLLLPNSYLPRFALNNSDVTADEVFRRIDYTDNPNGVFFWGVEGESTDGTFELEVLYDASGNVVENVRNDILDTLPPSVESALLAQYPDATINEIERATSDAGVAYAILFDTQGEEIEGNYDENGTFLHIEDIQERSEFPAAILAVVDSRNVDMPLAEYEKSTFADGSIGYAVEFENNNGQSITINMNSIGDILTVEHEDALGNLSTSETVETALASFPEGIKSDFSTMFSEVMAAEIFRHRDLTKPAESAISYGIEGVSEDGLLEIEAIYSPEIVFLEQERGELIDALPTNVDAAFMTRYPGVEIDEIARVTDDDGVSYSIVFIQNEEELEANFSDNADFLVLEDALEESEIPLAILDALGAERVLLPILEVEKETAADGSVSYSAEYENETGESISYSLTEDGTIESIEHEGAI